MSGTLSELEEHLRLIMPSNERLEYIAFMGNAQHRVKASGVNKSYVIKHDKSVEIVTNERVPNQSKLQVVVGYDASNPTLLQILRQVNAYLNPPYPPVAAHAEISHGAFGYDPVWVRNNQILSGLATPAANSGMIVALRGHSYYMNGWHVLDNQLIDFTDDIPASGAVWVVVEVDEDGVLSKRTSDTFPSRELLVPESIPKIIDGQYQEFACRCYLGQVRIIYVKDKLSDLFDLRFSGQAGGGTATSIDWDDVIGKPDVFPPDTAITDLLYPRKWYRFGAPNNTSDEDSGYSKSDIWVDQTNDLIYLCAKSTSGAAVWLPVSAGAGGGGGVTAFSVNGRLAVCENATSPILITADSTINEWPFYVEGLGSFGSTIVDVIRIRAGEANISIFEDYVYGDARPELTFDDPDHLVIATPIETEFLAGDVLQLNICQIADEADTLILGAVAAINGGSSLTVTDGVTEVGSVRRLEVYGGLVVANLGDNAASITAQPFIPNEYILSLATYASAVGFAPVAGSGFGWWLQSTGAQNDEIIWNINLPAGTYTLKIMEIKDTVRGIYHWYIDGSEVGTVDAYGSLATIILSIAGGVVSDAGVIEIKLKMETKNGSSSAYYGTIFGLALQRTGD